MRRASANSNARARVSKDEDERHHVKLCLSVSFWIRSADFAHPGDRAPGQNSLQIEPDRHGQVDARPGQFQRRRREGLRAAQERQCFFVEDIRPR
jgi:hypothetical protein